MTLLSLSDILALKHKIVKNIASNISNDSAGLKEHECNGEFAEI